jgi:hypothetical protein
MQNQATPWVLAIGNPKNLGRGVAFGIFLGTLQLIGYQFHQPDWGGELLFEHIPFNSLVLGVMFLWPVKALSEWLSRKHKITFLEPLVERASTLLAHMGVIPASIIAGLSIVVAITGYYPQVVLFLLFSLYLFSLAEIAANPVFGGLHSKAFAMALGIIIGLPISLEFLG